MFTFTFTVHNYTNVIKIDFTMYIIFDYLAIFGMREPFSILIYKQIVTIIT